MLLAHFELYGIRCIRDFPENDLTDLQCPVSFVSLKCVGYGNDRYHRSHVFLLNGDFETPQNHSKGHQIATQIIGQRYPRMEGGAGAGYRPR